MTKQGKKQFDDVLKRMLGTAPSPHEKKGKAKKAPKAKRVKK